MAFKLFQYYKNFSVFFFLFKYKNLMKKLIAYTCLHQRYTDNKIPAGSVPYLNAWSTHRHAVYLNAWSTHRHAVVLVWHADPLLIYGYVVTTLR